MAVQRIYGRSKTDTLIPREAGLTNGYDMRLSGVTLYDVTGSVNGTISGPCSAGVMAPGTSLKFNTAAAYAGLGSSELLSANSALSFWVRTTTGTGGFIFSTRAAASNPLTIYVSAGGNMQIQVAAGGGNSNTYTGVTLNDGKWHHIVFNRAAAIGSTTCYADGILLTPVISGNVGLSTLNTIGSDANSSYICELADFRIYSSNLAATKVSSLYFAKHTSAFRTANAASVSAGNEGGTIGAFLSNTPFQFGDATTRWQVNSTTINGEAVKVLTCAVAGLLYVPCTLFRETGTSSAYGEWEFWLNKSDPGVPYLDFVADRVGGTFDPIGYQIVINGSESILLRKVTGGGAATLCSTANSAIAANTWYKFKIVRSPAGAFTVYINDVLMSVVGGSGTNPVTDATYTTSTYLVLDFDATDKIAFSSNSGVGLTKQFV